jgi:preprotein translocase SecF subunit
MAEIKKVVQPALKANGLPSETATLNAREEGAVKGTLRVVSLTMPEPVDGQKLLDTLLPLEVSTRGGREPVGIEVTTAQLSLTNPAFVAQVKSLLDSQLKSGAKQEVNLSPLGAPDDEGRYTRLELTLPTALSGKAFNEGMRTFKTELAARPLPQRLENFDSQLAADTQQRAVYAIVASWGAIMLFLWFRFGNWTFGTAAVLCLVHDVCLTLGLIAVAHYVHEWFGPVLGIRDFKIDLPAVAALLTLIGFSVNDTIVVFDRIREVRGKNPNLTPEMINLSINQTLSRTILTSLTAWLVVAVLYAFGGEGVHLFAFVMVAGVIVGTISSIFVASPLLLILGEGTHREGTAPLRGEPAGTGVAER